MARCIRITLPILVVAFFTYSFTGSYKIPNCYLSFDAATDLTTAAPEQLPETAEKFRAVKTDNGMDTLTRMDGYRILYNNEKGVPFVNVKVELSEQPAYTADQKKLIANLNYLNTHSPGMETKNLIELSYNGYKVYGLSRSSIEAGSILGTFVMFPGEGIVVYFYFNNLKPELRNFNSVEDYKKQRDRFIEEYTKYLKACSKKTK